MITAPVPALPSLAPSSVPGRADGATSRPSQTLPDARGWASLLWLGGLSAALLATLTVLHTGVFFVTGLPATVEEWFTLFQRSAVLGLLAFELLMVLFAVLSIPVALALFVVLRRVAPSLMTLFVALSLVSSLAFVVGRPAFEMLALATGHASAATEAQRAAYLGAGEAMLAVFHGTAFWVSYVLGSLSGLLLAAAMLRTTLFRRGTAYLRIASSALDFGLFIPTVGLFISLGSVICLLVFNVLVARRLFQLAAEARAQTPVETGRRLR